MEKGITGGLVFLLLVILALALTGKFAGREQDEVECTPAEWSAYSPECNRLSLPPSPGKRK
jgi:Na+-transporting methylmalonyl-CoA/oxaloacetate decarboxylase gamma subunit